ncbi:hypothetical protein CCHR01_09767 [Colletotrichum chrysophilum]|uniref:Secreted protein n=1 Tax=Colletotrichum chrysophilum TaxID=1836956 RepID=A0AAD9AIN8_9PEZI|nr:hypothetical protein CCHR01_09767 [Colletotrichum chrysophilum]
MCSAATALLSPLAAVEASEGWKRYCDHGANNNAQLTESLHGPSSEEGGFRIGKGGAGHGCWHGNECEWNIGDARLGVELPVTTECNRVSPC